jgi:hypothetical protein
VLVIEAQLRGFAQQGEPRAVQKNS